METLRKLTVQITVPLGPQEIRTLTRSTKFTVSPTDQTFQMNM